jgi:hypothetical protein
LRGNIDAYNLKSGAPIALACAARATKEVKKSHRTSFSNFAHAGHDAK